MRVSEVMHKVFVIDDDVSLKQAAKIMSEKGIGSLVIVNKDEIIGIVTESDILKNIDKASIKVSKIMSKNVKTIGKNETLDAAAELMAKNKIKRLPVVHEGNLVGIITATDLIANAEEIDENFFFD